MVLCLESGGGEVTEFGLMAATLARVRESGIPLTVCVDKVLMDAIDWLSHTYNSDHEACYCQDINVQWATRKRKRRRVRKL